MLQWKSIIQWNEWNLSFKIWNNFDFVFFFQTNASNEYYAISIYYFHVYRTKFLSTIDQYCYFKIKQKLTKTFDIYSKFKNISTRNILFSNVESILFIVSKNFMFFYFVNNDFENIEILNELMNFLHFHYFFRLFWNRFIIYSKKSKFFVNKLKILKFQRDHNDIRFFINKSIIIRNWSIFVDAKFFMFFIYMFLYLKILISNKINLMHIIKKIILKKIFVYKKTKKKIKMIKFNWKSKQQKTFETTKNKILIRNITIENSNYQYHLTIDASIIELKKCLFQLVDVSKKILWNSKLMNNFKIVMFMSFQLLSIETKYYITKRECYAIIKCFEKRKWMIIDSKYFIKFYTNHFVLLSIIKTNSTNAQITK